MKYLVYDMVQCTDERVNELLPLVSEQRREYALRYKHTFGRFCALQSWLMVEHLTGSSADWSYNQYGKPYIDGGLDFSLSHCKRAIAVAVDNCPIGIDVESIRHVDDALIARTMNEAERAMIHEAQDTARMFTRLWTRKEAYLKWKGTGIADDLQQVLNGVEEQGFMTIERDDYIVSIYTQR
ncbi:MAG: 4'-phosphopantetheinyl transferase superfamily protein [Paludibacteraceae bacterium]|nr:4'-phosphopantetheinyl transferase superfamily protein [Paludibacteraceae bacterium]